MLFLECTLRFYCHLDCLMLILSFEMLFHDLFLCQKYNFGRTFGHFNSNCIINANGKGVKSCA